MNATPLSSLWSDVWIDLNRPGLQEFLGDRAVELRLSVGEQPHRILARARLLRLVACVLEVDVGDDRRFARIVCLGDDRAERVDHLAATGECRAGLCSHSICGQEVDRVLGGAAVLRTCPPLKKPARGTKLTPAATAPARSTPASGHP